MTKCKPFLKWAGGKRWLAASKISYFPISFDTYYEPFLGSGAVFFAISPTRAVLSDTNVELILTYKAIKSNWRVVLSLLKEHHQKHCKDYYYMIRGQLPCDYYQRAARFIYLNRTCWNGLYRVNKKGKFNVPIGTKTKVVDKEDNFELIAVLLRNCRLLNSDFEDVIDEAGQNDLVYVDPPYTINHSDNGFTKYNEKLFDWADQIRLRDALVRARNRGVYVVVSNAYHQSIRELYEGLFRLVELTRYSIISGNNAGRKAGQEYLILGV
jgi:DNA adenine methylase